MSEKSSALSDKKRIYCNRCKNETNHVFMCDHSHSEHEEENGQLLYWEEYIDRFWICAGCDEGTLERCFTMSGYVDSKGNQIYESNFYPERKRQHVLRKWFKKIPKKLETLYREAVEAYNNKLYILCAAGLRALIEGICVDKGISGHNLESKIDSLTSILPENIVKNLHGFRFMGNEALHELNPPNKADLLLALEVSEDLMNFIYELDYKTSQLTIKKKKEEA